MKETLAKDEILEQYSPECEERMDAQTDRQTDRVPLASTAVCIASNADAL